MGRLWQVQYRYYWQLVKYRFWLVTLSISVASCLVGTQLWGDICLNIVSKFFMGPTTVDLHQHEIVFPSLWLCYYLFPLIIVGNSFQVLWKQHVVQLLGYHFSKAHFGQLNLILVNLVDFLYTILGIGSMAMISCVNNTVPLRIGVLQGINAWLIWGLLVYAEVLLILLFQLLGNLINTALGLFGPTVLLVLTIYWDNCYNPLNLSVFQRASDLNMTTILVLVGSLLSLMLSYYYYYYRYCEVY